MEGAFRWIGTKPASTTRLEVTNTKVRNYEDADESWVGDGLLLMRGFQYQDISQHQTDGHVRWRVDVYDGFGQRLSWLRRQPDWDYSQQPYHQFARWLTLHGHRRLSRLALMEGAEEQRRRFRTAILSRIWTWVMRVTTGHGYLPERSLFWIALWIAFGMIVFSVAYDQGYLVQTSKDNVPTTFSALMYSVDSFLPIGNFRQEQYWIPSGKGLVGLLIQAYGWLHTLIGWALGTLAIAAFSGIMRKAD